MEYPHQVMKIRELIEMGFPKEYLMEIYRSKNQKIAWKMNNKRNSPILFDTKGLERYRKAQCVGGDL